MTSIPHPWEDIYQREGRVFKNPFPGFARVAQEFRERGCEKILDLGCGSGRHVVGLARLGFRVFGMDISGTALRLTRQWLGEQKLQSHTVQGDLRFPLPFRDASFSGVLSTQVIHHALLIEVRRAIAEVHRVLAPGGVAFITVSGRRDEDMAFEEIEPGTYVPLSGPERGLPHHIFTREALENEFAHFKVEQVSELADGKVVAVLATRPPAGA